MKIGIYSPYFQSFGGGERYVLTAAEFFLQQNNKVDIFWNGVDESKKIKERFDIDLSGANYLSDIFFSTESAIKKLLVTQKYDLFFFLSDGSIPSSLAKKNILHFQTPFNYKNQQTVLNKLKLTRFNQVVCNSIFTKKYIDKTYGVVSKVLYPPVDIVKFSPGKKENIILSVGRFASKAKAKKQELMINSFGNMVKSGLKEWKLVLIGALQSDSQEEVERLRSLSKDLPIEILTDCSFSSLQNFYSKSSIYWHAKGFGDDLENHPDEAEHFGITTVESMASGCVPVVFRGGGQLEIIDQDKSGFFWDTTSELENQTFRLIKDSALRTIVATNAVTRSKDFSKEKFNDNLKKLLL